MSFNFKTEVVLVVEDDPCLWLLIERALHSIDREVEVLWVTEAEEALRLIEEDVDENIGFVLTDHFLAGPKTGLELWERLREIAPELPVVVTSGFQFEHFLHAVGSGNVGPMYLQKPFTQEECRRVLGEYL